MLQTTRYDAWKNLLFYTTKQLRLSASISSVFVSINNKQIKYCNQPVKLWEQISSFALRNNCDHQHPFRPFSFQSVVRPHFGIWLFRELQLFPSSFVRSLLGWCLFYAVLCWVAIATAFSSVPGGPGPRLALSVLCVLVSSGAENEAECVSSPPQPPRKSDPGRLIKSSGKYVIFQIKKLAKY